MRADLQSAMPIDAVALAEAVAHVAAGRRVQD